VRRVLAAVIFACALALPLPVLAQQPPTAPPDPAVAIFGEWQAMLLAQNHAAERVNELIMTWHQSQAAYEARLATAMEWLKAAQGQAKAKEQR
jgi:hypothetical protein